MCFKVWSTVYFRTGLSLITHSPAVFVGSFNTPMREKISAVSFKYLNFLPQVLLCFEKTLIARIQRVTVQRVRTQTKHVSSLSQCLLLCYLHMQFLWSRNLPLSIPYCLISDYNASDQAKTFYLNSCWSKTFSWATAEDTYHLLLLF